MVQKIPKEFSEGPLHLPMHGSLVSLLKVEAGGRGHDRRGLKADGTVKSMLALGKKQEKYLTEEIKCLCSVKCLLLRWGT